MGQLTFIVGGVRSGKSRFAEQLAAAHDSAVYLATAQPGDEEMARRIERHRQRRAKEVPGWRTIEEPWDIAATLRSDHTTGCVLVECLTLWLTNRISGLGERPPQTNEETLADLDEFIATARHGTSRVIVVSNEVGCGITPVNALARRFGDLLGEANQRLAAAANEVYACIAGIPMRIK